MPAPPPESLPGNCQRRTHVDNDSARMTHYRAARLAGPADDPSPTSPRGCRAGVARRDRWPAPPCSPAAAAQVSVTLPWIADALHAAAGGRAAGRRGARRAARRAQPGAVPRGRRRRRVGVRVVARAAARRGRLLGPTGGFLLAFPAAGVRGRAGCAESRPGAQPARHRGRPCRRPRGAVCAAASRGLAAARRRPSSLARQRPRAVRGRRPASRSPWSRRSCRPAPGARCGSRCA